MVRNMWVTHGMMRAMCKATKKEVRVSGGEKQYLLQVLVGERNKEKKREKKGEEQGKKEKGNDRKKDLVASSSSLRRSDSQSLSG